MLLNRARRGFELRKPSSPNDDLRTSRRCGARLGLNLAAARSPRRKVLEVVWLGSCGGRFRRFPAHAVLLWADNPFQHSAVEVPVHGRFISNGKELAVVP